MDMKLVANGAATVAHIKEDLDLTNITKWILEETNQLTGTKRTREYTDYQEALDAFTSAEEDKNNLVSLSKKTSKLLVEEN